MNSKVLIVEDDHLMARMLTNLMVSKEYQVVLVITLARLEEIDLTEVAFAISGINIVGGKTLDFWKQGKGVPLILMSAVHPSEADLAAMTDLIDFLEKPFPLEKLMKLIEKVPPR